MIKDFLIHNAWSVLLAWGLAYLADYYLTIYFARLLRGPLQEHIRFEGSLELTPVFQKDVDALRLFSPSFLLRWLISFPLLALIAWLSDELGLPQVFYLVMGGLLLRQAVILLRHGRNIALGVLSQPAGSLHGRLEYSRWLSLRLSAAELFGFGTFFALLSIAMESWFFLGGALVCLLTGSQHWAYSRKHPLPDR